jgi:nicotinate-nucleotide adenylyltransferase
VGVFGGAFDPPHIAHIALAQAALEQLQLDELRVVPTGQAWHKSRTLTPAVHRLEMTRLAFAAMDRVVVDARETLRSGPSFTVDTLAELSSELPAARLFLVIGEDQAAGADNLAPLARDRRTRYNMCSCPRWFCRG